MAGSGREPSLPGSAYPSNRSESSCNSLVWSYRATPRHSDAMGRFGSGRSG